MRYCQAQALVHSLAKDELLASLSEQEKTMVSERILEEVRGRMMEEIVLLETYKSAKKNKRVFKLTFSVGEYDMVIYDSRENTCECYEIKHSDQIVSAQTKYLIDEEMLNQTTVSMNCSGSVLKIQLMLTVFFQQKEFLLKDFTHLLVYVLACHVLQG